MEGGGWRSGGVGAKDIRGWGVRDVVQNRESPDLRSPGVGRYGIGTYTIDLMEKTLGMLRNTTNREFEH